MKNNESKIRVIDRDTMKYLAMLPMAAGHFCGYIYSGQLYSDMPFWAFFLMQAALFAPPVFFLFIAEGFRYTRSRKKYAMRLLLFAVITQVPFCLVNFGTIFTVDALLNWNIFLTLFLGLLALIVW